MSSVEVDPERGRAVAARLKELGVKGIFDEAHLLFDGASKPFVESITQTVRLIRSKGVGVFLITQTPKDLDADVLAQLGNRVQHALRALPR